jgi:SAM-dependent methyltransferase
MTAYEVVTRVRLELGAVRRPRSLREAAGLLSGAEALEPGGPSALFGRLGVSNVYAQLASLDTLDFAERTLWSANSQVPIAPRRTLIGEASRLDGVADDSYDALLTSHVIEHLANPIGALREWSRVVRPGGHVLLVVPHRDGTFDHRRATTSLGHLLEDAEREMGEDDLTHLPEILADHDLDRDPGAPSREVFEQRCRENHSIRGMHHHVFVSRSVFEMCDAAGLDVLMLTPRKPFNIVCLCRVGETGDGVLSMPELSRILRGSPFASDRAATPAS